MKDQIHEELQVDPVIAWRALKSSYPQAQYTTDEGGNWFRGSFRDDDDELQTGSLDALIRALTAREGAPSGFRPGLLS